MKSLFDLIDDYQEQEGLNSNEGTRGLKNLCKLVRALGYRDPLYFGQFQGGAYGDLIEFFEDNSGAITAVLDWIGEQELDAWKQMLADQIEDPEEEEQEEAENGLE